MPRRANGFLLVFLFLVGSASLASAALDTPTLSVNDAGHAKLIVTVTAGSSGLPEGFTIWWMDAQTYQGSGGQWPATLEPGMGYASFTGVPTLNTFGGLYTTFRLGPNESIMIEVGDLFDESGVQGTLDELEYGEQYYFASFANDANGDPDSPLSNTVSGTTTMPTNCTYTIGYWKTHKEVWPVFSLQLGDVVYNIDELCAILDQPVEGNGLVSLAHQLIAAKLNILNGADPTDSQATIDAADALIGSLVIPPVGGGYIHPSQTNDLTQVLDDFNNGIIGPGHCGTVGTEERTLGNVKVIYR